MYRDEGIRFVECLPLSLPIFCFLFDSLPVKKKKEKEGYVPRVFRKEYVARTRISSIFSPLFCCCSTRLLIIKCLALWWWPWGRRLPPLLYHHEVPLVEEGTVFSFSKFLSDCFLFLPSCIFTCGYELTFPSFSVLSPPYVHSSIHIFDHFHSSFFWKFFSSSFVFFNRINAFFLWGVV